MNFIKTLKSVGGVKPCTYSDCNDGITKDDKFCPMCHGDGEVLDLAPLLAKPRDLEAPVKDLVTQVCLKDKFWDGAYGKDKSIHVVGPQRASNLVYEVARQLGGMAVTCFSVETMFAGHPAVPESLEDMSRWETTKSVPHPA